VRHTPERSRRGGPDPAPDLPLRDRVLWSRAEGLTLAEIALRLRVTRQTVCNHLKAAGNVAPPSRQRCADCGAVLTTNVIGRRGTLPVYCHACLGERPDAPFGVRLKSCRLAAGLTAEELADRAGVSARAVGAYESGRAEPGWGNLLRLARVLGPWLFPQGPAEASRVTARQARHAGRDRGRRQPGAVPLPCRDCGGVILTGPAQLRRNGPALCLRCLADRPDATFGQRLKAHRLAAGLTLKELARRADLRYQNLSAYERGVEPNWRALVRLVNVLGTDLVTLGPRGPNRD
jgi:transcriptional regulator with XRE-family HTH domain